MRIGWGLGGERRVKVILEIGRDALRKNNNRRERNMRVSAPVVVAGGVVRREKPVSIPFEGNGARRRAHSMMAAGTKSDSRTGTSQRRRTLSLLHPACK